LGNGNGFSVQEVIDAARAVTGRNFSVVHGERRPGDPARLVADSRRARTDGGRGRNWAGSRVMLT